MRTPTLFALAALAACATAASQEPPAKADENPMNKVLLKDWAPKSNLVVPETKVEKPKFPAIEGHIHPQKGTADEAAQWVKIMDEVGLDAMVMMTNATGEKFDRLAEAYGAHPGRFVLLCGIDTENIDDPGYPERAAAEVERCYRKGARGLGEITDKGFGVNNVPNRGPARLHIDDARLDPVWKKCAELKIAANIHAADHISAWQPPDRFQERLPSLQKYNHYGRDIPPHAEMVAKFLAVVARHPQTTFVAAQLCNLGHDLAQLGRALDQHPNLSVDTASRLYELGRQPFSGPKFAERYKDRFIFGTDEIVSSKLYPKWYRFFETRDEYIQGNTGWRSYGQGLSDGILKALYQDNARRIYFPK